MRAIYCVLIVLAGVAWVAAHVEVDGRPGSQPADDSWRRAAGGWENAIGWFPVRPVSRPALHPAVVAALQLMLSVWALLIAPTRSARAQANSNAQGTNPPGSHVVPQPAGLSVFEKQRAR